MPGRGETGQGSAEESEGGISLVGLCRVRGSCPCFLLEHREYPNQRALEVDGIMWLCC
jgi:hypothetical protein